MKIKTLGIALISALLLISILFIAALIQSQREFDRSTTLIIDGFEKIALPLGQIDSNTKNLRFHLYASFMHDTGQSVSKYHTHPLGAHIDAIKAAHSSNQQLWAKLATVQHISVGDNIKNLNRIYDAYLSKGIQPGIAAAEAKDWDSIVRTVTGSLTEYFAFEKALTNQLKELKTSRDAQLEDVRKQQWQSLVVLGGASLLLVVIAIALVARTLGLFSRRIQAVISATEAMAKGDLSAIETSEGRDDVAEVQRAVFRMQVQLRSVIKSVRGIAESVAGASAEIAQGNRDLSARTESQASALGGTTASMDDLNSQVRHNSDNALQANQLASSASKVAIRGGEVVGRVVETMKEINDSSKKISDIISVIDGIAFQTNILALNAAVEAARAGEQGRGFAVVASEVRSLAGRSAAAAKEIKGLINASVERVEHGSLLVDEAGSTMTEIVGSIRRVSDLIGEISNANIGQATGVAQMGEAVTQMDHSTQQNSALVEQMAAATSSLASQANELVEIVAMFKIGESDRFDGRRDGHGGIGPVTAGSLPLRKNQNRVAQARLSA